jgi:glycosyltransferase involved in cell wall biosynthesis
LLIGRLLRIPVVISEHWTAFPRGILTRDPIYQARLIFRLADAVLPVSHALQRSLEHHGVIAAFQVVPNVVDTDLFTFHPRVSESAEILRLLAVTSLVKHKGLYVLFSALKQVAWQGRRWHLDIVGDGAEEAEHHLMVQKLGLAGNVIFHGQLHKNEVAQMMRQADLFVCPSLVETFSVATAEALASGVPAVVTRCGGPEEFVTKQSGVVVPPGDATALAEALTKTIERLPTFNRSVIAEEARAQFGLARVGAMLDELYARLIDDRSRSIGNHER